MKEPKQLARDLAGIVVSAFNPSQDLIGHCAEFRKQAAHVVVVDDGSTSTPPGLFETIEAMGCTVLRLGSNRGIAYALNRGILTLSKTCPEIRCVITMDQDSILGNNFVEQMVVSWNAAIAAGISVGMVAAAEISGLPHREIREVNGISIGDEPIQSGLLIPLSVIETLGYLDERLFIDGVDSEFFLRARDHGYSSVLSAESSIKHSLGTMVDASIGGVTVTIWKRSLKVRVAAPWRYYYIVRNRLILSRRYAVRFPMWVIKGWASDLRHIAYVSVLAPDRLLRLRYAKKGLMAGVMGITGKMPRSDSEES